MDVFEAVRTVLAVREYEETAIPESVIHKIVEAGRLTGSSMNKQPWHFIVVEDRDMLQKLGAIAETGRYTAEAAAAIVVAIEESRFAVSDASRAIQSMILTAWSEGVGSNWVGFFGLEEARTILDIPEQLDILAIVPLGYPTQEIGQGIKDRKPPNEVIHHGRFGEPFDIES